MRKKRVVLTPEQVVKELRIKKEWSLLTLSEITGIAVPNLSNIENGKSRLSEDRAILLATALGVNPSFILFPNGFERNDLKPKIDAIKRKLKTIPEAS